MAALISQLLVLGFLSCGKAALPATPLDLAVGRQPVDLRLPLEVQNHGARLVLLIRDSKIPGFDPGNVLATFRDAVPTGSVSAVLTSLDGTTLAMQHTDYTYYKGYKGLVLTGTSLPAGDLPQLYSALELDARVALGGVRVLWLDRAGLTVRDVYPRL